MSRNHRNFFKRQYVRLKGWLTLGSVGITPRLVFAFAAVAALAAAANLIVENGVSILEQQRNAELVRSTHDSQAITTLRESVGRAEKLVTSAKLSVAMGVFDRAVHEHADADSRASAARYSSARASLAQVLKQYVRDTPASNQSLTRVVNAHRKTADTLVQATRKRREPLRQYSRRGHEHRLARQGIERQCLEIFGHVVARQPLLDLHARLSDLRAAVAMSGAFGGDASTVSLANAEQAVAETLRTTRTRCVDRRVRIGTRAYRTTWYRSCPCARVFVRFESQRFAALDAFARESRKLAALLPADFAVEPQPLMESVPVSWCRRPHLLQSRWFARRLGKRCSARRPALRLLRDHLQHRAAGTAADGRHQSPGTRREYPRRRQWRHSRARYARRGIQFDGASSSPWRARRRAMRSSAWKPRSRSARASCRSSPSRTRSPASPIAGSCSSRSTRHSTRAPRGERVGVFFLDIDNFKTLNDSMGHAYGDRVLIAIARRLEAIAQLLRLRGAAGRR